MDAQLRQSVRALRTTANTADSHKSFPNCAFTSSTLSRCNMAAVTTPTISPSPVRTGHCPSFGVLVSGFRSAHVRFRVDECLSVELVTVAARARLRGAPCCAHRQGGVEVLFAHTVFVAEFKGNLEHLPAET